MKKRSTVQLINQLYQWGFALILVASCRDKETAQQFDLPPQKTVQVDYSIAGDTSVVLGDSLLFISRFTQTQSYASTWFIDNKKITSDTLFTFTPKKTGSFSIKNVLLIAGKEFTKQTAVAVTPSPFVSELITYVPAPGQFINTSIGKPEAAKALLGKKANGPVLNLGSFGGYASYGFSHPVENKKGNDLIVFGNAFKGNSEPAIIWVMADKNQNGKADDTWYELKGSAFGKEAETRNYSITYYQPDTDTSKVLGIDNQGKKLYLNHNTQYHKQAHYPTWMGNSYTLSGTLLKGKPEQNGQILSNGNFEWGYADNFSPEYSRYKGNQFDLDNAIDQQGKSVKLKQIKFIKIQSAVHQNNGDLGEVSPELSGIANLHLYLAP